MNKFDRYIDQLVNSCCASIEQMTRIKVNKANKAVVYKDEANLPFAHIIRYQDPKNKLNGEFVLGFQSIHDALKLASAIAERLGLPAFDKVSEDSIDLLNEFLNIVVGRTISEWDAQGLKVNFDTPVFKKNYISKEDESHQGYIIALDIIAPTVDLEKDTSSDQIIFRVNFVEKVENKIKDKVVLLAEDSKVMRTIIGKILKQSGAIVIEAKDGLEAVKLHKLHSPDLCLMDINMPNLNGLDAIARIKEDSPKSKFIILSSSSRKDEIISAKTLKVSGYLVKPVEPDKLIERVTAVL